MACTKNYLAPPLAAHPPLDVLNPSRSLLISVSFLSHTNQTHPLFLRSQEEPCTLYISLSSQVTLYPRFTMFVSAALIASVVLAPTQVFATTPGKWECKSQVLSLDQTLLMRF